MSKFIQISLIVFSCIFSAEKKDAGIPIDSEEKFEIVVLVC